MHLLVDDRKVDCGRDERRIVLQRLNVIQFSGLQIGMVLCRESPIKTLQRRCFDCVARHEAVRSRTAEYDRDKVSRNIPVLKVGPRAQFHELFAQVRYPHFYADAEAREEPAWGCGLALFNRIGFGVFGDNFENKTFP
jgi:hypothetical protein